MFNRHKRTKLDWRKVIAPGMSAVWLLEINNHDEHTTWGVFSNAVQHAAKQHQLSIGTVIDVFRGIHCDIVLDGARHTVQFTNHDHCSILALTLPRIAHRYTLLEVDNSFRELRF